MPWLSIDGVTHELRAGESSIGRSPNCDIVLQDDLASRRHATFFFYDDEVSLRDNDSRNGTMLNGKILVGSKRLNHLDRVVIGASQIVYFSRKQVGSAHSPRADITPPRRPTLNNIDFDDQHSEVEGDTQATNTLTGTGHLVIGTLVAKSLDAGDLETAGRVIQNLAQRMTASAEESSLTPDVLAGCSDIVMRFAEASIDPRWVEWVLDIHTVMKQVPPRYSVDVICSLGAEGGLKTPEAPRRWLAAVRSLELTAEQRFLISRIEGLERQLSA